MIVIEIKRTKGTVINYLIQDNPSPGTWGELQLLKQKLFEQDEDYSNWKNGKWEQLEFNTGFLKMMLEKHGELHCEYCGKPNLIIYSYKEKPNKKLMATADHFLPKNEYPQLSFTISNMLVCCDKCNQNKKDHIWDKSKIKFPYPKI